MMSPRLPWFVPPASLAGLRGVALALAVSLAVVMLGACQTVPAARLTPEQVGTLKQEGFEATENGWELGLPDKLLFPLDEDSITDDQQQMLLRLGRTLGSAGIDRIRVDGHTDDLGGVEYNQQLSLRRAQAVARVLSTAGFATDSIEVRGLGESRPVADNRTPAGRTENRRVAIIVTVD